MICRQLARNGHKVTILTSDHGFDEEFAKSMESENLSIVRFRNLHAFNFYLTPGLGAWLFRNLKGYDVVHLHNVRSYQNNLVRKYAGKYHVPYVLQAHGDLPHLSQKQMLKSIYDKVWGRPILRDSARCLASNQREREQFLQCGLESERVEIVPNGVDADEFRTLPGRDVFLDKYGIRDDAGIVLFLGRLNKIKGLDLLIEAFAALRKEKEGVKLVIAGPDDGDARALRDQVRQLGLRDDVVFTGPLYGRDKVEAYACADVYVLPSTYDMFPVTVLEACACGIPVVVTEQCGISALVKGRVGHVVRRDAGQLMAAMLDILDDADVRHKFGDNGIELVNRQFTWESIMGKLMVIYRDSVAGG